MDFMHMYMYMYIYIYIYIYITASVTVEYVRYHMLQVGGREEICIILVVPCCGKRVSFWFDSSQDCYASGLDLKTHLSLAAAW